MPYIEALEICSNNRSKCRGCINKITKGEIRGMFYNEFGSFRYFCQQCCEKKIKDGLIHYEQLKERFFYYKKEMEKWKMTK